MGGLDLNKYQIASANNVDKDGTLPSELIVASSRRLMIVKVGEKIQGVKNIQFPGCLESARRGTIACVADGEKYALLELEHEQKISLFPISSTENSEISNGYVEDLEIPKTTRPARGSSFVQRAPRATPPSVHNRSTSLGNFVGGLGRGPTSPNRLGNGQERLGSPLARDQSQSPVRYAQDSGKSASIVSVEELSASRPSTPVTPTPPTPLNQSSPKRQLKPQILSLTEDEFLLTTGTSLNEPGVGIFVNLDGDVVRGTIDFERYPRSILALPSPTRSVPPDTPDKLCDTIYALMDGEHENDQRKRVKVLQLSSESGQTTRPIGTIPIADKNSHVDIRPTLSAFSAAFPKVSSLLQLNRLRLPPLTEPWTREIATVNDAESDDLGWEQKRAAEEQRFARVLGKVDSRVALWIDNALYCLAPNPFLLQMEAKLGARFDVGSRDVVREVFDEASQWEAQTEKDFLSYNYIRQKASFLFFAGLLEELNEEFEPLLFESAKSMLLESNLDPRTVMLLLPVLREEILQGPQGIWLPAGLTRALESVLVLPNRDAKGIPLRLWQMIIGYLTSWQEKRGFGSIADEEHIFKSVDAGQLHVLLHLDDTLSHDPAISAWTRVALNNLVDHWSDDFGRAIKLLERYERLFLLSRLYQSRRLAKEVLVTWKRVIDGAIDKGGEITPDSAQMHMRRYLVKVRDRFLVQEYGTFLAQVNPALAVEVFVDSKTRVHFPPNEVLSLLKRDAPRAVQPYLECLVFDQGNTEYTDDLISYSLDSVLDVLDSSETARNSLSESYATYRALDPPKPTYLDFIRINAPAEAWWQSRLRLLRLLGGGQFGTKTGRPGMAITYSIQKVLDRLSPFSSYLVSESIILDAHQGKHSEALRLLTHGLGDYDTAVRYCYFGRPPDSQTGLVDESQLPSRESQAELFNVLLEEFLRIENPSTRMVRSCALLASFTAYFDVTTVLDKIPDTWTVEALKEFLLRALRAIRTEMLHGSVVKALSAAENICKQAELVDIIEQMGARIEAGEGSIGNVDDHREARKENAVNDNAAREFQAIDVREEDMVFSRLDPGTGRDLRHF